LDQGNRWDEEGAEDVAVAVVVAVNRVTAQGFSAAFVSVLVTHAQRE